MVSMQQNSDPKQFLLKYSCPKFYIRILWLNYLQAAEPPVRCFLLSSKISNCICIQPYSFSKRKAILFVERESNPPTLAHMLLLWVCWYSPHTPGTKFQGARWAAGRGGGFEGLPCKIHRWLDTYRWAQSIRAPLLRKSQWNEQELLKHIFPLVQWTWKLIAGFSLLPLLDFECMGFSPYEKQEVAKRTVFICYKN